MCGGPLGDGSGLPPINQFVQDYYLDDRFQNSNHTGPSENAAVLRTENNTQIDGFHGFARLGLRGMLEDGESALTRRGRRRP